MLNEDVLEQIVDDYLQFKDASRLQHPIQAEPEPLRVEGEPGPGLVRC